jgi:hypothetical protein
MFNHPSTSAPAGTRRALVASAFIAALVAPIAVAPPALASQTVGSCTITAYTPRFLKHDNAGTKVFDYPALVHCTKGGRTVYVQHQFWEADIGSWAPDDYQGQHNHYGLYYGNAGGRIFHAFKALENTETGKDGDEEIYQRARMRVCISDVCQWSEWDKSPFIIVQDN